MQHFKYLGLALTGALVLSACGSTNTPQTKLPESGSKPPPVAQPPVVTPVAGCATLTVNLQNVTAVGGTVAAPVSVKNAAGETVFSGTAVAGKKLSATFLAGKYTVIGHQMQGYQAPNTPQSVSLDCTANKDMAVTLEYRAAQAAQQQVKSIALSGDAPVRDVSGAALPGVKEANINKDVMLYAAQTEEPVLVQMIVRDAAGAPVAGARVSVSADSDSMSVVAGHVQAGAAATTSGITAQALMATAFSDAEGIVRFTVYATSAPSQGTPVKFVVSATDGADAPTSAALAEFKMFFANMSHLYYQGDTSFGASDTIPSKQRLGGSVGSFENNWFNTNQRLHTFGTVAFTKQPEAGPYPVGGEQFPGYVKYTLEPVAGQESDLQRLFLTTNASAISGAGKVTANGGQNVYLRPALDLTAQELPLTTNVRAEYYYRVRYGNTDYDFLLKSYLFTKTFSGAVLDIEKTGPSIITWTGFSRPTPAHDPYAPDDVNLPPRLDDGSRTATTEDNFTVGKTYTYQIRVRNTSGTAARNVTVRDELPAELGYVLGSARLVDAAGANAGAVAGDYDLNTHTIDFNEIGDLAAGAELRIAIDVYARQKPGYAWNDNNRDGNADPVSGLQGAYGITPPETSANLNTEYEDPYDIKNRAKATASNAAEVDTYKYINVVRPVARITKTALDPEVVTNQQAEFLINVANFDRSTTRELDPRIRTAYAQLKSRFPNEYSQEGFLYKARIEDTYGPAFSGPVARDEQGNIIPLERLDQVNANDRRVGLDLGTLQIGASRTIRMALRGEVVGARNFNCVRLFGWNLNQIFRGNESEYLQFEGPAGTMSSQYALDQGRNFLESCDYVDIVGKPAWGRDLWDHVLSAEEFDRDNGTDAYPVGSQYVYDMYYDNEGTTSATNVFVDAALPRMANLISSSSIYIGFWTDFLSQDPTNSLQLHQVDLRDSSTWTFTVGDSTVTVVPSDDRRSFRFHVDNMEPAERIGFEFGVVASQKGDDLFRTSMTWDQGNGRKLDDSEHTFITD
ncbi:DUF11 domain-containing protein [Deinococcus koreensis]|uniref:DUF11 domain-containing protein n=1 Tax=Deinococcus koreensis TaxID=2054903 RepID=A0A2K3UZ44_9DEIO|nr:DUF11 domain-containing protein [Deinococcus koreensis]PNY81809.1 hypothetical protein CVO96_10855 [Deinococcus koreensis]